MALTTGSHRLSSEYACACSLFSKSCLVRAHDHLWSRTKHLHSSTQGTQSSKVGVHQRNEDLVFKHVTSWVSSKSRGTGTWKALTRICFNRSCVPRHVEICWGGASQLGGIVPLFGTYTGKAACVADWDIVASCCALRFILCVMSLWELSHQCFTRKDHNRISLSLKMWNHFKAQFINGTVLSLKVNVLHQYLPHGCDILFLSRHFDVIHVHL